MEINHDGTLGDDNEEIIESKAVKDYLKTRQKNYDDAYDKITKIIIETNLDNAEIVFLCENIKLLIYGDEENEGGENE